MIKENKTLNKDKSSNDFIVNVDSYSNNDKTITEIEYIKYMSEKAKSINTIIYPDGSKGELNKSVVVLLF